MRSQRFVLVPVMITLFQFINTNAQTRPYTDGLPDSRKVIMHIRGNDEAESCAKKIGALKILFGMIRFNNIEPYHRQDTPGESALISDYNQAIGKLQKECMASIPSLSNKENLAAWRQSVNNFEYDKTLIAEIVETLMSDATREKYNKRQEIKKREDAAYEAKMQREEAAIKMQEAYEDNRIRKKVRQKTIAWTTGLLSVIFIVASFMINVKIRGRQFDRTNEYGTQIFENKKDYFMKSMGEGFLKILAQLCMSVGLILFVISCYNFVML